jgi:transposase
MDIRQLTREGHSIRSIARVTGLSRNTIRRVLRGEHDLKRKSSSRASKLDPYHEYLRKRRAECPLSAVRLMAEIRPMGYEGSIGTLRRYLATLDDDARRERKLTVRFETPPGHQAQVDWGYAGTMLDAHGRSRPVYVFIFVLSYSRVLHIRFTTSMNLETLIDCHRRAFAHLGGWPKQILYDNMKQVRIGPGTWNAAFLDFSNHHGFTPKTHRPYRPRTKGKVERAVEYVKDSFILGRQFVDLNELNAQVCWFSGKWTFARLALASRCGHPISSFAASCRRGLSLSCQSRTVRKAASCRPS